MIVELAQRRSALARVKREKPRELGCLLPSLFLHGSQEVSAIDSLVESTVNRISASGKIKRRRHGTECAHAERLGAQLSRVSRPIE
jgi:hypothetical protein